MIKIQRLYVLKISILYRTPLGRARAWLRLALMQKTLADYFKILIEKKDEVLR